MAFVIRRTFLELEDACPTDLNCSRPRRFSDPCITQGTDPSSDVGTSNFGFRRGFLESGGTSYNVVDCGKDCNFDAASTAASSSPLESVEQVIVLAETEPRTCSSPEPFFGCRRRSGTASTSASSSPLEFVEQVIVLADTKPRTCIAPPNAPAVDCCKASGFDAASTVASSLPLESVEQAIVLAETEVQACPDEPARRCLRRGVAPPPGIFLPARVVKEMAVPVRTTVVFRNLAPQLSKFELMNLLDDAGLCNTYNFLYLPIDFRTSAVLGYAIVNFNEFAGAWEAFGRLEGAMAHGQEVRLEWSNSQQGFDTLVQRYRNSHVMHGSVPEKYKPIVFEKGCPVPFPPPTTWLQAPRRYFAETARSARAFQ